MALISNTLIPALETLSVVPNLCEFLKTAMGSTVDAFRDALFQRFEAHGSDRLSDLVAAIKEEARDAQSYVGTMLQAAKALSDWYDKSGQREFLDNAIEISQEFVETPNMLSRMT